jgi:hypothetical protein
MYQNQSPCEQSECQKQCQTNLYIQERQKALYITRQGLTSPALISTSHEQYRSLLIDTTDDLGDGVSISE